MTPTMPRGGCRSQNRRGTPSDKRCPSPAELLAFVDADLSPERLDRVEEHLSHCSACAKEVGTLTGLVRDIAAPLSQSFDVNEHVEQVMQRLERGPRHAQPRRAHYWNALLAAAAVIVCFVLPKGELTQGVFMARGGHVPQTLARDIGVQLYVRDTSLQPLSPARRIKATAAMTAGLRNLGRGPAYLLLFAVDAQNVVHWIAPEFTVAGSDPVAVTIPTTVNEQPLPNSVVFDDLAPGRLRVLALITTHPLHVSQIESLSVSDLTEIGLKQRFAGAEVRQTVVEVIHE